MAGRSRHKVWTGEWVGNHRPPLLIEHTEAAIGARHASGDAPYCVVAGIEEWWASGATVRLGESGHAIFVRRMGAGPSMDDAHAFLSSSYDWARVAPALARRYALLLPDLLGFGASEEAGPSILIIDRLLRGPEPEEVR